MKSIFITLLALAGLAATSCEKKTVDDKSTVCGTCFASSGATVSWTDYNSVADLHSCFNHHDSTLMRHIGDTIRLCGWVYYPDHEAGEPLYDVMIPDWSVEGGTMFLVDNEDHHFHGNYGSAFVTWPERGPYMRHDDSVWYEEHADFVEHFSEYLPKKWYVTARIEYDTDLGNGCCSNYTPRYRLIAINTIKK